MAGIQIQTPEGLSQAVSRVPLPSTPSWALPVLTILGWRGLCPDALDKVRFQDVDPVLETDSLRLIEFYQLTAQ